MNISKKICLDLVQIVYVHCCTYGSEVGRRVGYIVGSAVASVGDRVGRRVLK